MGTFQVGLLPDRHVCAAAGAECPGLGQYHHLVGRDHGLHPVSGSRHLRLPVSAWWAALTTSHCWLSRSTSSAVF